MFRLATPRCYIWKRNDNIVVVAAARRCRRRLLSFRNTISGNSRRLVQSIRNKIHGKNRTEFLTIGKQQEQVITPSFEEIDGNWQLTIVVAPLSVGSSRFWRECSPSGGCRALFRSMINSSSSFGIVCNNRFRMAFSPFFGFSV